MLVLDGEDAVQRHTAYVSKVGPSLRTFLRIAAGMACGVAGVLALSTSAPAASVSTWSIVPSANATSNSNNTLDSVSCSGPMFCMAVGGYDGAVTGLTLTESWNGASWSVVPSPNASPTHFNQLNGVSCASAASCVAVGTYSDGTKNLTLAESWNGSSWIVDTTVNPSTASAAPDQGFNSVACTSPTSCIAVGSYTVGVNTIQTLVESWNGSTWSVVPSPNTSTMLDNFFNGVACSTPTSCVAVGQFGSPISQTLTEWWNGVSWAIVASPNTSPTFSNVLNSVTCTNSSFCMAVGYDDTGSSPPSLIEMWNGTAWSIVSGPSTSVPNSDENFLYGVSCTDPSNCVAAGHWSNTGDVKDSTLIESWDGSAWSVTPSPNASPTFQDDLLSVSCGGGSQCVTVGQTGTAGPEQTLVALASVVAKGYYEVASDGGLFAFNAPFYGSMGGKALNAPVVGMAVDPATGGYWEVASDGGLFSFNAPFYGSMGGKPLNKPIVGMAYDPATGGYWEVASDGGLFAFNAPFLGSTGNIVLNKPVVGMAALPDGSGYYEVASDGGLFAFHAPFLGSTGNLVLNKPVVGMALDAASGGYYEVASDGGLFAFTAPFLGSMGGKPLNRPVVGMAAQPDGSGYWEVASDGGFFAFNAPFLGSTGNIVLNKPVVGMATS
jgi:hypothetical protein